MTHSSHSPAAPLRVVVLGAGGVGGHFGGELALAGHDVTLLARGDHLAAIRDRGGLELRHAATGASRLAPVRATDDHDALPDCDLVLVAVKSYSLGEVAGPAVRLGRAGATVMPLLNGVDAADRLVALGVPREALLGGLTFISVAKAAPGVIEHRSPFQRIVVGRFGGAAPNDPAPDGSVRTDTPVERIVQAFGDTPVDIRVTDRIEVELWHKLTFIAAIAAACGLSRTDVTTVLRAPMGRLLFERAVGEILAVARAHGVAVDDDAAERTITTTAGLTPGMKPSLLLDVERGGPTEVDVLSGAIARLGRRYGVPTPIHDTATAAIGAATGVTISE